MDIKKPLKILFIHNNYAHNNSGEEHAAEALKIILESHGHQVKWFRRFSDIINNSLGKKIQAFFSGVYNPSAVRELKLLLDDFQPDVVQVQNLYPFISPGIVKTIKRRSIPLVMRCPNYRLFCPTGLHLDAKGNICEQCLHGARELNCVLKNCERDLPKSIGYGLRNFMARTFWKVNKTMDAYIVQTAFQRQKFIDNGIPANKLFIISGLSSKLNTLKPVETPTKVTYIGRISEEKGICEFLEAAKLLPNIPFVIVGGLDNSNIKFKDGAPSNVVWKGFVAGKALDELYADSKMVVVPSKWYEGFPNVITQAMMHGKPVITSKLGAMANIIDHNENGVLVPPGDVLELSKAIKELFYDEAKAMQMGKNGYKKVISSYSGNKVYEELDLLYSTLLNDKDRDTKKILFLLHYPPPVHGAAMVGRFIMESECINSNLNAKYINLGTSVRVDEIGNGGLLKFKRYFRILFDSLKVLCFDKPKLVYITLTATGLGFYKDAFIALIVKIFGVKVVYHFHNKGVVLRQNKWLDNILYKLVFKNAEVILLSKHLYGDIEKYVPLQRVHFCPNGIPKGKAVPVKCETPNNTVRLLFLSNLITTKGVEEVLIACSELVKKQLLFECRFIGNNGDISTREFQDIVSSLNLENYIFYEGPKYGVDKDDAYAEADIFVFPTCNDCFPLVLIEAMQYNLPVVSTFEGAIPDIVENGITGFLVEQKNTVALAEKLEELIKYSELRKRLGEAGRKRYEDFFTLKSLEKRFVQIITELI